MSLIVRLSSQQTSNVGIVERNICDINIGISKSTSSIAKDVGNSGVCILLTQVAKIPVFLFYLYKYLFYTTKMALLTSTVFNVEKSIYIYI
jgi:hypothetical protein